MKISLKRVYRIIGIFILVIAAVYSVFEIYNVIQSRKKVELVPVVKPHFRYGIPVDSFTVVTSQVGKNQFLGEILGLYGIGPGKLDSVARLSANVFDVRKMRAGNSYSVFLKRDSLQRARYFVYEITPIEYVVFELFDSLCVYRANKIVEKKIRTSWGIIQSSLWNTMQETGTDPILALSLSEIYAWTIDFFALQKGDRYRAVYEEMFVDSVSIGIGKVHTAEFEHYGKSVLGFRFIQNDTAGYYNETGENLQKEFLKAPLKFSRISSHFSGGRLHPILRIVRPHHGVDYAAPKGTPVMSIGTGTVIDKGYRGGGGNQVKIRHNSVYTTQYMHLSGYGPGIFAGARVVQGQVIGYVGSTGLSTGPHLDFRVYRNGGAVNPLTIESPPAKPVNAIFMIQFNAERDSMLKILKGIEWKTIDEKNEMAFLSGAYVNERTDNNIHKNMKAAKAVIREIKSSGVEGESEREK